MRSQLFAFNLAQPMQPARVLQDTEMTYDVDAQVWVGGAHVTADNIGDGTDNELIADWRPHFHCTFYWNLDHYEDCNTYENGHGCGTRGNQPRAGSWDCD